MADYFPPLIIEHDFRVRHAVRSGLLDWFVGRRPPSTRRAGAAWSGAHHSGVWHVVVSSGADPVPHLRQWCVPDYAMDAAVRKLDARRLGRGGADTVPLGDDLHLLSVASESGLELGFRYDGHGESGPLSRPVRKQLRLGQARLERASSAVSRQGNEFLLPGVATKWGNPVNWRSPALIEAIAYEQLRCGVLDDRVGVFSLFSGAVDMFGPASPSSDWLKLMVDAVADYTDWPAASGLRADLVEAQRMFLPEPIWEDGRLRVSRRRAASLLRRGLKGLPWSRASQCIALTVLHQVPVLWPLAVVAGRLTFDRYADLMCRSFAPDSDDEFRIRQQCAHVRLFGELAENPGTLLNAHC